MNTPCSISGCDQRVGPGKRKYCAPHSRLASTLWKRRQRQANRANGVADSLDSWLAKTGDQMAAIAARREYMRAYMRAYRARHNGRVPKPSRTPPSANVTLTCLLS